jgi:hypothetical protein
VVWNGHTTKIEFKKLRGSQNIHHVWEDGRQLITCVKYERASGGRCWIVAYSEKAKLTLIYRPSALLDKKIPVPANKTMNFELLWNRGALQIDGISEGHIAVAELIRETHK